MEPGCGSSGGELVPGTAGGWAAKPGGEEVAEALPVGAASRMGLPAEGFRASRAVAEARRCFVGLVDARRPAKSTCVAATGCWVVSLMADGRNEGGGGMEGGTAPGRAQLGNPVPHSDRGSVIFVQLFCHG